MESSDSEEDYGLQRPSLIRQLRSVLDQYPDDGQILKELIQNAEDAGATEVKFLYDENSFPTNSLHHPEMARFQGPALYSYNNATFSQEDWKGIRMLQASVKEKDPMKVGRFGLGFKSVLHITDLPSVLSRDRLFIIDPHERFFLYKNTTPTSGYAWHLKEKKARLAKCPDQFTPYMGVFGSSQQVFDDGYYDGTLFRFPLRQVQTELSDTIYDSDRVDALFKSFIKDAHLMLLFLKNLEKIEIYQRTKGADEPVLLFRVNIAADCLNNVRKQRQEFKKSCQSPVGGTGITKTYRIDIDTQEVDSRRVERQASHSWLVTEHLAGDHVSTELKELCADTKLSLIPLVGVALDLKGNAGQDTSSKPDGQIFCFLPLPTDRKSPTGLPVHVNGYFAVDQNRRNLKWPADIEAIATDKSVKWNQRLIQEVIPVAYGHLLQQATRFCQPSDVYIAMPDHHRVSRRWEPLLRVLYTNILNESIIFTRARGGHWAKIEEVIVDHSAEDDETSQTVHDVLLDCDCQLSRVPAHVLDAVSRYTSKTTRELTPDTARCALKKHRGSYADIPRSDQIRLLSFTLQDGKYSEMTGLHLLPRADGVMVEFTTHGSPVYIPTPETPRELFPGLEGQLLAEDLDSTTQRHLENMTRQGLPTCLHELTHESVSRLLQTILPKHWRNNPTGAVSASESPVPAEWFQLLWRYLGKVYRSDLSEFNKLHILPLQDKFTNTLVTISSQIVFKNVQGMEMPQLLDDILQAMGVFVIGALPQEVLDHPLVLGNVVKVPSDSNLVELLCECLSSMGHQKAFQLTKTLSGSQKKAIVELLSRMSSRKLQINQAAVLRKLPFFPSILSSDESISISDSEAGAKMKDIPCSLSVAFVDISERAVCEAVNLLGLRTIALKEILQFALQDARDGLLDSAKIQVVAERVFELIHEYRSDTDFMGLLAEIPFVTCGTSAKKPRDLFDPRDQHMATLYGDKEVFPTGPYAEEERLKYLCMMGLKSSSNFSAEDALEEMKALNRVAASKSKAEILVQKAQTLILMLSNRPALLDQKVKGVPLKKHAEKYAWIPVLQTKSEGYPSSISWKGDSNQHLATPGEVASPNWSFLVGSVSVLATVDVSRIAMAVEFREVTLSLVLDHLSNIDKKVYKYLADHPCENITQSLEKKNMDRWIWHGDGFATVDTVYADQLPINLHPYAHQLPPEMKTFQSLFAQCGMQQACDHAGLKNILLQIQETHRNQSLENHSLRLCIDILNLLKAKLGMFSEEEIENIIVPTCGSTPHQISMAAARDCCYVGEEGHEGLDTSELAAEGIHLLHPDVPLDTARKLNVSTVMSRLLPAEDIVMEDFGQNEPLTTRLKNLLGDYSDGLAIFKEMIQNADDAGATEVGFLYDERTNDAYRKRLLDPEMSECQGPALWVYNNETFTDQDFVNITRLGGGMKQNELNKIGKFGLGFNVVYNLTDVPSLASKNYLAIFDPHTTHLGNVLRKRTQPGIKLDLAQRSSVMETISDQFKPYHGIFGCKLGQQARFEGTLFRLPLRTRRQAGQSDISNLHYSRDEMMKLFHLLAENAHSLLLFTQNVTSVTFQHLHANGEAKDAETVFRLTRETICDIALDSDQGRPVRLAGRFSQLSVASRNKNRALEQKTLSCSAQIETSTTFYENAHFNHGCDLREEKRNWLVAGTTVMPNISMISREGTRSIQHGNVAVKVQEVDDILRLCPLETNSLVFCFLPLPIPSRLNVHINGTFSITSSRQHIAVKTMDDKDTESGKKKAEWNKSLLCGVICQSYKKCLSDCREILPEDAELYAVWPHPDPMPIVQPLVKSFFDDPEELPFFIRGGEVVRLGQVTFFDDTDVLPDIAGLAMDTLRKGLGVKYVTQPPTQVIESLRKAGKQSLIDRQMYSLRRFYVEVYFPNIQSLSEEVRNRLLVYAINLNIPEINHLLGTTRCMPTSAEDNELKLVNQLIDPQCKAVMLFREEEGQFPAAIFTTEGIIRRLRNLGLKNDLSWFELVERAKTVQTEYQRSAKSGKHRKELLCEYLERKLSDCSSSQKHTDWAQQIRSISFLEAKKSKREWPFPYRGDKEGARSLFCPNELYDQSAENLISTTELVVENVPVHLRTILNFKTTVTSAQLKQQTENIIKFGETDVSHYAYKAVMHSIYNALDGLRKNNQLTSDFKSMPCVLVDAGFVVPSTVTFKRYPDLMPYLFSLPVEFVRFRALLVYLGVQDQFGIGTLVQVTQKMATKYGSAPLSDFDRRVTVNICEEISSRKSMENTILEHGKLFVPNSKNILCLIEDVCYDDCPWVKKEAMTFLHKDISFGVAERLNVKPVRQERVRKHQKGIAFGQTENLTNSLKRILRNCTKADVLKEMIQNADDAGATEIHFIRDSRNHGKTSLFSDSWEPLQGPSLCVYNNTPFTERDLDGIQKLGEGSKGDDPRATGQYGVGFCSVYHLTDAPSILTTTAETGQTLCVFDPHCTYVQEATALQPGMRYDMDELEEFTDVFSGYQQDQCDLTKGSMFRLPLRSESMAKQSKIANEPVTMEDVHKMLESLKLEACEILLFLNNLEKIKISDVDSQTGKLVKTYTAQVEMSEADRIEREEMRLHIKECSSQMTQDDGSLGDVPHESFVYNMTTKDNYWGTKHWCVSQQFGFRDNLAVPDDVETAFQKQKLSLMPRGAVAYCIDILREGRHMTRASRLFCFLPLEREISYLPVHVNGHFALDHENRKQLVVSKEEGDYRSRWNELLFSTVIAESYCNLLGHVQQIMTNECQSDSASHVMGRFGQIFPTLRSCPWQALTQGVYKHLADTRMEVFPSLQIKDDAQTLRWFPLNGRNDKEVYFDTIVIQRPRTQDQKQEPDEVGIVHIVKDCGMAVAEVPREVGESIKHAAVDASFITPDNVVRYLHSPAARHAFGQLPQELSRTPLKTSNQLVTLLKFLAKDYSFFRNLHGLPLLLTNNGQLRCFDTYDKVFEEDRHGTFPKQQELFVDESTWIDIFLPHRNELYQSTNPVFQKIDISSIAGLTKKEFPELENSGVIAWPATRWMRHPSIDWLKKLWLFVHEELSHTSHHGHEAHNLKLKLAPLAKLCVIPAFVGSNMYLCPLQTSAKVVHMPSTQQGGPPKHIVEWLRKLNPMQLYHMDIHEEKNTMPDINRIPQLLVTSVHEASVVLGVAATNITQTTTTRCLENISTLKYFQEHLHSLQKADHKKQLESLPLYETFSGKTVSLSTYKARYTVPNKVPNNGLDFLQRPTEDMVFLKENGLSTLYTSLGCKQLNKMELYCDFIFQHLELFEEYDRNIHLSFAYRTFIQNQGNALAYGNVLQKLSQLRVFMNGSGERCLASDLHDPNNTVFGTLLPPESLASIKQNDFLNETEMRKLLIAAGMITELTEDHFLNIATNIAQEGKRSLGNIRLRSVKLVKALFAAKNNQEKIASAIKDIPFLVKSPAKDGLTDLLPYHGQTGGPMMAFNGSVIQSAEHLVWSEMSLLDDIYYPKGRTSHDIAVAFGIHDRPPVEAVVRNLRKLAEYIRHATKSDRKKKAELIETIYQNVYQYLSGQRLERNQFENLPIILTRGCKPVEAKRIVLHLSAKDEMPPYLYTLPPQFGNHAALFKKIGTADGLTADHFLTVLGQIKMQSNGHQLLPNELHVVYRCVKGFFSCLEDQDISADRILYLPNESAYLHESTSLVANDAPSFYSRLTQDVLPFVVDVRDCGVQLQSIQDVFEILPRQLHPKRLSELVEERLPEEVKQDAQSCQVSLQIETRLRDDSFCRGLRRLLTHDARLQNRKHQDEATLIERLSTTHVRSVRDVRTLLFINNKPIAGSDKERSCCVHKEPGPRSEIFKWTIYIKRDEAMDRLEACIGEVLNEILDGRLGGPAMYLLPILRCPIGDIQETLDELNVGLDHTQTTSRVSLRVVLGSLVPDRYQQNLTPGGDDYDIGEVVAYSSGWFGTQRVFAQITAESEDGSYTIKTGGRKKGTVTTSQNLAKFTR